MTVPKIKNMYSYRIIIHIAMPLFKMFLSYIIVLYSLFGQFVWSNLKVA